MEKLLALAVRKRRDKGLKVSVSVDSLKAFYSELCSVPAHPALLTMLNCNYSVGCLSAAATMDAQLHIHIASISGEDFLARTQGQGAD